jgi:predicted acetyltransferase
MSVDLHFSTSRAKWSGPEASGRLHFISSEQLVIDGQKILDRVRLDTPGEIQLDGFLWKRLTGIVSDSDDKSKNIRAVRYDDAEGTPQGFAIYKVVETGSSFSAHRIDVDYLVSATPDAANGLWRFLLEMDLVSEVHARLRPLTDPVVWQVADFRAVTRSDQRDHLWVRVLDVIAALEARTYSAPGKILLDITDPLGFSDGRFLLSITESGTATVTSGAGSDAAAHVSLSINEIGALYLGGTSAATLVAAGRVTELTQGAAEVIDASFRTARAPLLSFWF